MHEPAEIERIKREIAANAPGAIIEESSLVEEYSIDKTKGISGRADIVAEPENAEEIAAIMRICSEHRYPVTVRGGGTGVTGGAVPVHGGLILSMKKMNRILEIDRENMIAVVEPGAVTGEIQKRAKEAGLFYPPDPASLENCTIGGNVAESAGGPRAVKYGTTKDYILGIEFITADGKMMKSGGKFVKNATGYNLTGLITGSEGTLAIITKIYLKLIPYPAKSRDILIPFQSIERAIDAVYAIIQERINPSALEFIDESAINLVNRLEDVEIPFPEAGAHLLIQLDGNSDDDIERRKKRLLEALRIDKNDILEAKDENTSEMLWRSRRKIRDAISSFNPVFFAEDSVVPRSEIPSFIKGVKRGLDSLGANSLFFGHAGDGNVHINIMKGELSDAEWERIKPEIKKLIYTLAIEHNGTISGEHGIGFIRRNYMNLAFTEDEIELMKRIKLAFDPLGILNPYKIFKD